MVVEFRDSQVSWGPVGPSEHAPFLVPLPTRPGLSRGRRGDPQPCWLGRQEGGQELSDPSGRGELGLSMGVVGAAIGEVSGFPSWIKGVGSAWGHLSAEIAGL